MSCEGTQGGEGIRLACGQGVLQEGASMVKKSRRHFGGSGKKVRPIWWFTGIGMQRPSWTAKSEAWLAALSVVYCSTNRNDGKVGKKKSCVV